jgi:hypothetical protein
LRRSRRPRRGPHPSVRHRPHALPGQPKRMRTPTHEEAVKKLDRVGDARLVAADDLSQVRGIELRGERRRADKIANITLSGRHAERAAFGLKATSLPLIGTSFITSAPHRAVAVGSRSMAIASSRMRPWPTIVMPRSLASSPVSFGNTTSIPLSRNAALYC